MASPTRYQSSSTDASPLGKPLEFAFSKRTASNRFLKAAMTERLSSWDPKDVSKRGIPSDGLINVYKHWGEGEIGLILTGNIMVHPEHLEAAGNPIVLPDAPFSGPRFEAFQKMAAAAKAHGSLCVAQVSHPGRQVESRIQPDPVSASDVQLEGEVMGMRFAKPHAASIDEIKWIINAFAHTSQYLEKAGYDGVELHGAHGYLLAQFLSATTNQRTDQYGGSVENRTRIITEMAAEVKRRTGPNFILGIKLNSVEFQNKGFSTDEAKQTVALLERAGVDIVELSGGTYEELAFTHKRESTKKREAFFMEFADAIVPALSQTKTYVTGGFKSVGAMVDALKTVDGIGLARPLTQEPRLAKDMLAGRVSGAIEQLFDQSNFGITNVVAGSQIRQIAKDNEPLDGSKQKNVDAFMQDMQAWAQGMSADAEMNKYGYVDIEHMAAVPYGTAAAS